MAEARVIPGTMHRLGGRPDESLRAGRVWRNSRIAWERSGHGKANAQHTMYTRGAAASVVLKNASMSAPGEFATAELSEGTVLLGMGSRR